jgi:hypothetical protein
MAQKRMTYVPTMGDDTVKAKTGRTWSGWFAALDKAGAAELGHAAIAALLAQKHGVSSWWCQMVTVEYERARGLRVRHETASGFSVAISKTIATQVSSLYEMTADATRRRKWFPRGKFKPSSHTANKYYRGSWQEGARLDFGFVAKGDGKAQIAVQVNKLASKAEVEAQRAAWKQAFTKLADILAERSAVPSPRTSATRQS